MQPITVALGLTVTVLALTALLAGPSLAYLAPHTRVLAIRSTGRRSPRMARWPSCRCVVALYATARAAGLADLGRKVDLVERSIRRGAGGDPELAEQMQQQDRGDFEA